MIDKFNVGFLFCLRDVKSQNVSTSLLDRMTTMTVHAVFCYSSMFNEIDTAISSCHLSLQLLLRPTRLLIVDC